MNGENIQESTQNLLTSDPQDVSKKIKIKIQSTIPHKMRT